LGEARCVRVCVWGGRREGERGGAGLVPPYGLMPPYPHPLPHLFTTSIEQVMCKKGTCRWAKPGPWPHSSPDHCTAGRRRPPRWLLTERFHLDTFLDGYQRGQHDECGEKGGTCHVHAGTKWLSGWVRLAAWLGPWVGAGWARARGSFGAFGRLWDVC
jgi:hypothetical protein